jgi:hypothetical protein
MVVGWIFLSFTVALISTSATLSCAVSIAQCSGAPMHLSTAASDLAELRIANTELRQMLTAGHVTELPNPLRSHRVN